MPAARVGAEALAFVPLKHGRFAKQATESQSPLKGAQAAWLGMNLTPERFAMYWGMRADDLKSVAPYLKPREGQSLLGLATGGIGAGRITFSPDVSWKAIKEAAGDKLDTVTGAVAAATALDAEKDFIENLTGEMVFATYRSDSKTDQAGKPLDLRGRASTVIVFGSRDDVRTRNVSEKLGGLIGGAVASYGDAGEQLGVKMSTRTDAGDRPVRWVTLDLQETAKTYLGLDHLDVFLTSIPGGLVLGYGKTGLVELLKRVGKKPAAFLDTLPLPEEKAPFSTSPFVAWARAGEGFGQRLEQAKAMTGLDDLLPGAQKILLEVTALGQLMFDSFVAFDLSGDRAELFFQVTFL